MNSDYLVSIIMPAYNAAAFLPQSIGSVQAQTYKHWELIVIDDGSTDQTCTVVNDFASQDNRIRYVYQQNGRQGKARNYGLMHSKGTFIAFLDADDLWLPEHLAFGLKLLQEKQVDLVFGDSYIFRNQLDTAHCKKMNIQPGFYAGKAGLEAFLRANKIPILTVLAKSYAIKKVGGFTEDLRIQNAEDYHLWVKLLVHNFTFFGSSEVLAAYRINMDSASAADRTNSLQCINAICNLAQEHPQLEPLKKKYLKYWVRNLLESIRALPEKEYEQQLHSSFRLINQSFYIPFLSIINVMAGRKLSLRLAYFILNKI